MKDSLLLLATGLAGAVMAWAFFHYLGVYAALVLQVVVFAVLIMDNRDMRRKLREHNIPHRWDGKTHPPREQQAGR
ncbi:hypothetical protein [Eleftheria terrae]|uniref:hypothetical protein n=1 Tax=Eleftheria terrae TaxID=1597781 RepID=UPI00263BD150|nr:hypothetical protein [Eleftheria terrae]WKB52980.1 hypothetical protein N7L95_00835 [Eleftheria terrae]